VKNFKIKKFILATLVLLPILLLVDVAYDALFKTLDFSETFALKNLVFKILAALVGAYFYATYNNDDKTK
jgi:hypothetical protein